MKIITVVTPCFNEELNIRACYDAVRNVFETSLKNYQREHIFCDNASTDGTVAILRDIAGKDKCVKIIINARNFGPMRSNFNGVMAASGDAVLLFLPADLQDPPELLPKFIELWEQGSEIVFGIRATREENWPMRSVRAIYYKILSRFAGLNVPPGAGDFQLVDRRVVEAMRQVRDSYPFMRMMTFECGGRAVGVPYTWRKRERGISKNRLVSLFDQGMNGIVSFTIAPVRLGLLLGFVISFGALLYAIVSLIIGLLFYRQLTEPGIMTIIVALFFFGGVQLAFLGMVGEYVLAIHGQVRSKPVVFERERINFAAMPEENKNTSAASQ